MRRWLLATLVVALVAACSDDSGTSIASTTTARSLGSVPPTPEVVGSEYRDIPLSGDPTNGTINTQVAVSAGSVLFYGGLARGEDSTELVARGVGALLDLDSGVLTDIPEWPYSSPPYSPAVVAIGDGFLVVGTPCAVPIPEDGGPDCGDTPRAAIFDPSASTWDKVPSPGEDIDIDPRGLAPEIGALGATGEIGYFVFPRPPGGLAFVVGYDRASASWVDLGPYASNRAVHCVTSSGLLRAYVSDEGALTAEHLDPGSGEWRSTSDGALSELPIPTEGEVLEGDGSTPPPPRPRCAGDQLIALVTGAGAPAEAYWYRDESAQWSEIPPPAFTSSGYPGGAIFDGVLVLWPNASVGEGQVLSADGWMSATGAPPLAGPELFLNGEEIVIVGLEPPTDTFSRVLRVGALTVEVA